MAINLFGNSSGNGISYATPTLDRPTLELQTVVAGTDTSERLTLDKSKKFATATIYAYKGFNAVQSFTFDDNGEDFEVNDELTLDGGDGNMTIRVDSIDGDGGILTYTVLNAGSGYTNGDTYDWTGGSGTTAASTVIVTPGLAINNASSIAVGYSEDHQPLILAPGDSVSIKSDLPFVRLYDMWARGAAGDGVFVTYNY